MQLLYFLSDSTMALVVTVLNRFINPAGTAVLPKSDLHTFKDSSN